MTIYNKIGVGYNATRKADPYIADRLYDFLSPKPDGLYLDIGCGTGNYLKALSDKGSNFYGIDPSEIMLDKAREKNTNAKLIQASAENIPLADATFNGAMAVLTTHHWLDISKGLQEVNRTLKADGRFVIFSFLPEQLRGYWLYHYFPEMIERGAQLTPDLQTVESLLNSNGFKLHQTEKYFVKEDLQDHFLYSNKYRPECYSSPEIRNGISAFSLLSNPQEVEKGVAALEKDIQSGAIQTIMKQYENDMGDYLFLIAEKRPAN